MEPGGDSTCGASICCIPRQCVNIPYTLFLPFSFGDCSICWLGFFLPCCLYGDKWVLRVMPVLPACNRYRGTEPEP